MGLRGRRRPHAGLGIGVNVSLFFMVSAFFLQPLPVKDAARLVMVMQRGDVIDVPYGHSYPDYLDYRESGVTFSDLVAYMPTPVHLERARADPERTWIEVVSPNYFSLAGVSPAFGEFPRPGADRRGAGRQWSSAIATGSGVSAGRPLRSSDSRSRLEREGRSPSSASPRQASPDCRGRWPSARSSPPGRGHVDGRAAMPSARTRPPRSG